jgi:hypothetical protein
VLTVSAGWRLSTLHMGATEREEDGNSGLGDGDAQALYGLPISIVKFGNSLVVAGKACSMMSGKH